MKRDLHLQAEGKVKSEGRREDEAHKTLATARWGKWEMVWATSHSSFAVI